MHFFLVNELKITQVELFALFHFKNVTDNISELFCVGTVSNESFLHRSNISFYIKNIMSM